MSVKTYINSLKKEKASRGNVNKPVPGHESISVPNFGGGYSLKMHPMDVMERFLILGVEGSYYAIGKNQLLQNNTKNIISIIGSDPKNAAKLIRVVSSQKRAISNDPAIYATALLCSHPNINIRQLGYDLVSDVCRTGTHLFHFCEMVSNMRGFSRGLNRAISNFYTEKDWDSLVYQTLKYRQRDGWSVAKVMRLAHPNFRSNPYNNALADYIVNGNEENLYNLCYNGVECKGSKQVLSFLEISKWKESEKSKKQMRELITHIVFSDLTQEFIPTWYKNEPEVQEALLEKMPLMATLRNISSYTASGLIAPFSKASKLVSERITNQEALRKAGVHPLNVFVTSRIYNSGRGFKGSLAWSPDPKVSSALEDCFNLSFSSAPVMGKNFMISVDVSGSMSSKFQNYPFTYCEVASCIALAMVKREPSTYVVGFSDKLNHLNFTEKDTLDSAVKKASKFNCGYTNAGLSIKYAIDKKLDVDVFLHITDNDFNNGKHPLTLTQDFREKMNKPQTRLMSVGLIPYDYGTIGNGLADGIDKYSMDISGFDSSIPTIIHKFCSTNRSNSVEEE